ncbi:hypothetical protein ACFFIX_22155 [Metabacillus herbersteinensis]|uniref:Transposase n=1 Tax=Metabacillus herbersteinensis TaxID=283816 RepID=A0ABV6GK30_9BACI
MEFFRSSSISRKYIFKKIYVCNGRNKLIAITLQLGIAVAVLKNYGKQRKEGKDSVFKDSVIPGHKELN